MIKSKLRKQTTYDGEKTPEKCLADNVQRAMEAYFEDLDGHETILRSCYEIYAGKYNSCCKNTRLK